MSGHFRKRIYTFVFYIFTVWLTGFVISTGLLFVFISRSISNPHLIFDLITPIKYIRAIQRVVYVPLESIPYLGDAFKVIDSGVELVQLSHHFQSLLSQIMTDSLQSKPVAWSRFETVFDDGERVAVTLEIFRNRLGSPWITSLVNRLTLSSQVDRVRELAYETEQTIRLLIDSKRVIRDALGYEHPQHVVVLTQNNTELWPTGGYLGSYVDFWIDKGAIVNLDFQDIGVPNGQLKGYVEAPQPISRYTHFGQTPGWTLRESNWNPDFPKAMPHIEWFFVEGGLEPIDSMVAINLIPVADLLEAIAPVHVSDYDVWITSENFYEVTQKNTSYEFFDGSTQKKDYLSALGKTLLLKLTDGDLALADVARVLIVNLRERQILISGKEEAFALLLHRLGIDGSLGSVGCRDGNSCSPDFLHINEANLGINKANCCVERAVDHTVTLDGNLAQHRVIIDYVNNNPAIPTPPVTWGGGYKVYQRWYVPENATLVEVFKNGTKVLNADIDTETVDDKRVIGFMTLIEGGMEGSVEVVYQVPVDMKLPYQLKIVKQSGIDSIPWKLTYSDGNRSEVFEFDLVRNRIFDF